MKNILRRLLCVSLVLLLSACSSGPSIRSDYDRSVDFSQYETYGFFSPLGIENPNYSTIYGSVFREAISREMESVGYSQSDKPDLLINVSAHIQDKTKVTQTSNPGYYGGGYYGYRRGYYDPWVGYGYGTTTHVSQYTEGTVNVDVVDATAKKLVFEGVAVGRLKENRTNEQVRQVISSAVTEMFVNYPTGSGD